MNDGRYHRYVLGELPEAERVALEDEYFSTEEGFQELQAAEDELLDAYAAGELSPERRARFKERFLRTGDDRQRVRYAKALQDVATRARERSTGPRSVPPWRRPLLWAAGLGAAALAGALLFQLNRLQGELRDTRSEREALERSAAAQRAELQQQERRLGEVQRELERLRAEAAQLAELAGSAREGARVVSLVLRTRLKRTLDQVPRLTLPPEASVVRLTLQLPAPVAAQARRASIQTPEGREMWARGGLRAEPAGDGLAVVLAVPASALAAGHHLVVVSSEDGAPLAEYVLQVVRL